MSDDLRITGLTGAGKLVLELQQRIDAARATLEEGFPNRDEGYPNSEAMAVLVALTLLDTSEIEL